MKYDEIRRVFQAQSTDPVSVERHFKMASEENIERDFNLNKIKESDALFMEIIQEYPTIYNRASKDFKDRNKKANCWKMIAQRLCEPVELVKRRYETIRTEFSRYLSKKRGKSGSGADDVVLDPKYEHLIWLKPFIISRQSSGNFKRVDERSSKSTPVQPPEEVDSSEESHGGTDSDEESGDSSNTAQATSNQSVNEDISNNSTKGKNKKKWKKTKSRKRKLEETDSQLDKSISSLNESIKQQENYLKRGEKQQMDEDSLYCMSLANRLQKLDDRNKAVVRNSIEKIFLDIQFGIQNAMQFTTQQPIQLGSQSMFSGSYMWQPTSNTFTANNGQQVE